MQQWFNNPFKPVEMDEKFSAPGPNREQRRAMEKKRKAARRHAAKARQRQK